MTHAHGKRSRSPWFLVTMPAEFCTRGVDEFSVGHLRGAHRLAGAASKTAIQMADEGWRNVECTGGKTLHQGDAAAGGFAFIQSFTVSGAMRQAQGTFHALVGIGKRETFGYLQHVDG